MMVAKESVQDLFSMVARLRSARALHPSGTAFTGTLRIDPTTRGHESPVVRAIGSGNWSVAARASKAIGTPGSWPDFRGMAVRIEHEVGPIDLLFTTVSELVPWVLAPARGWCSQPYTTFFPYTAADETGVLLRLSPDDPDRAPGGAVSSISDAVADRPLTFAFAESRGMSWSTIGHLTLADPTDATLSFDPVVNQHPRLKHSRLIAGFREWAYTGSRAGRHANDAGLNSEP